MPASSRPIPAARVTICSTGEPPKEGDVVRFPALAATLKAIAKDGARAFYQGEIAADMAKTLAGRGSFVSEEDFAAHRGEVVTPIATNYRGVDFLEIPPNGQGLTALVMLNILENFDLAKLDPTGVDRFHLVLEAARLAYGIRDAHIAEASHMRVTAAGLARQRLRQKTGRAYRHE